MANIAEVIPSREDSSGANMRKNPAQAVFDLYSMVISDYERADCFKYLPKTSRDSAQA